MLSPLARRLKLGWISAFQPALVVAGPVIVGSLDRIPVGVVSDRFGGRVTFPVVSFITVLPVLFLGLIGHSSLGALLVGGSFSALAARRLPSASRS